MKSYSKIFLCKCNLGNKEEATDNLLSLLKSGKEVYLYDNDLHFLSLVNNIKEIKNVFFHYMSEVNISQHEVSEITNELILNISCALKFGEDNSLPLHIYDVSSHNVTTVEDLLSQKNLCGTILLSLKDEYIEKIFTVLQSSTFVKHISLKGYNMDAYDINFDIALKQCQLTYLDISSTYMNSYQIQGLADALSALTSLMSLNLSNCKLQNYGMLAVLKALANKDNM